MAPARPQTLTAGQDPLSKYAHGSVEAAELRLTFASPQIRRRHYREHAPTPAEPAI